MDKKYVEELLDKYIKGTCTPEEKILLENLYDELIQQQSDDLQQIDYDTTKAAIFKKLPRPKYRLAGKILRYAVAASILICASIVTVLFTNKKSVKQLAQTEQQDIAPGGNVAVLTLSNGKKITLDDTAEGTLATQSGINVVKTDEGALVYDRAANNADNQPAGFNTAETPKGGQYKLQLTDGTMVWLNAASSLRFPVRFTGNEREVELSGEAYFEVAHNAGKPFIVKTVQEKVLVLGTQFNLNAYSNEPAVVTTLLQGSVKVQSTHSEKASVLKPGQQLLLTGNQFTIQEANVEEAVAWKNGYFRFNDQKIEDIMRKLERWYNIEEVKYEGKLSEELFNGKISRSKNISQVLQMLQKTESIHFKIEGRRVTVMP
ncbi:FecR family protein [Chitinophaga sp. S165]|uniref:FecR family protein n=1 Tax=Chitinophaga sp. S165 TaxID=2135462 RepID=UPI000D70C402|nr:FecR family protein [Chitinophaga sp. S165]PWV46538.1 FecR family protein [Chitinophaga sp. S165]